MATKRLKLQCWNCPKTYFESLDVADKQEVTVTCPYCNAKAVINLRPYHKQAKNVIREGSDAYFKDDTNTNILLPETLPTRMPGDSTTDAPPPAGDVKKKKKR